MLDVVTLCGRVLVAYTDQVLTCADCGIDFVFSASEQEFFAQKGFTSAPKRCSSCRAQRRATGGGGRRGNRQLGPPPAVARPLFELGACLHHL